MGEDSAPTPSTLTPSQAVTSSTGNSSNSNGNSNGNNGNNGNQRRNNNNSRRRNRNRRNNNNNGNNGNINNNTTSTESQESNNGNNGNQNSSDAQSQEVDNDARKAKNNRNRGRRNRRGANNQDGNDNNDNNTNNNSNNSNNNNNNNNNRKKKNKNKKKKPRGDPNKLYPWRKLIPEGTVDPITLEELDTMTYPPFALVASAPYDPVPEWPIPDIDQSDVQPAASKAEPTMTQEELDALNQQRLMEQWAGTKVAATPNENDDNNIDDNEEANLPLSKRSVNLYDGRALAIYLVSQLQFIDPLNRRDLNRDEIRNLDAYLRRHGLSDAASVTEAYDAKGVTLSTAGAAAATAQGRAELLQQTAQTLLNSLFSGSGVSDATQPTMNALQAQYAAMQQQETQSPRRQPQRQDPSDGGGVFASDDGGLMIIDDNENPNMRGGAASFPAPSPLTLNPNAATFRPPGSLTYSASHIRSRYGSGIVPSSIAAASFPALQASAPPRAASPPAVAVNTKKAPPSSGKPSKTLSRITGAVRKTKPQEQRRQWEAREAARRKAMMTNLSFGVDAPAAIVAANEQQQLASSASLMTAPQAVTPSDDKLQRNRNLAEALGVQPATMRQQNLNAGWARTAGADGRIALDEFGNELNAAIYPQALIMSAIDRMPLLLKIEKKWKTFLADDKAASVPLSYMDRKARTFTHQYSDFWRLHTESFDAEPKRYIHCVKLAETCTPQPLLSYVARTWRPGVTPTLESVAAAKAFKEQALDHTSQQTAGQSTTSQSKPARVAEVSIGVDLANVSIAETPPTVIVPPTHEALGGRFDVDAAERPKLELAKRTIPLELPPADDEEDPAYSIETIRKERMAKQSKKNQRAQIKAAQKQRALHDAFASDSDNEKDSDVPLKTAGDDDSDWGDADDAFEDADDAFVTTF